MKVMTDNAGISGKKTNHSARKTMITILVQNDMNPLHAAQFTGHKCVKSLDSYSKASLDLNIFFRLQILVYFFAFVAL